MMIGMVFVKQELQAKTSGLNIIVNNNFGRAVVIVAQMKSHNEKPANDVLPLQIFVENFRQDRLIIKDSSRLLTEVKTMYKQVLC